ncbi:hypothetical protein EZ313_17595 [Ramlibacter henchirensis]|jgi:ElaB/YqjD/DUF883 family membrane-anchored ribosome-binding protein|uniref:DUF883 family protein n=1 Tax=Ramlibacter henchirensis TaxID=204072 RepID=A0A4Z0BXH6_9BURK|nr:hypothetical protein [Ramlibacter henchirensis]TFZ03030.1 hypothetical protein EZ313_17595 [Ramlibacter henchirensis]
MAIATRSARAGATTQSLADDALERVRDLRYGVQDLANRSLSAVGESAQVAQERLGRYASVTGRYVSEQPVKSALIAAAVGAAVAAIVMVARSRRNRYYY